MERKVDTKRGRVRDLLNRTSDSRGISILEVTLVLPLVLGLILVLINQGIRSYNRSAVIYALTEAGQRAKADSRLQFDKWDASAGDADFEEYKKARQDISDFFREKLPSGVETLPVQHYDALDGGDNRQLNTLNLALLEPGQKVDWTKEGSTVTIFHDSVCLTIDVSGGESNGSAIQLGPVSGSVSDKCTRDMAVDPSSTDLLELLRTHPTQLCGIVKTFSLFGSKIETICTSTYLSDAEIASVHPTHTPVPNDCLNAGCGCDENGRPIQSASACLGCLQGSPYGINVVRLHNGGGKDNLGRGVRGVHTAEEFAASFNGALEQCYVHDWTIIWHRFGGCFDPEVKITLANGSTKRAADVHEGDVLLNGKTGESMRVTKVVVGPEENPMVKVGISEDSVLTMSQEHPVLTKRGLVQASELTMDDRLFGADKKFHKIALLEVLPVKEGQKVYNYEVESLDGKRIEEPYVISDGIVTGEYTLQKGLADLKKQEKKDAKN